MNAPKKRVELHLAQLGSRKIPVKLSGKNPLFEAQALKLKSLDSANNAPMAGGGSIVIDQTEALVAVDVRPNSGSKR